jgi:ABC-type molybdenum transport system ATPase subunit/photorepair protein PhrA
MPPRRGPPCRAPNRAEPRLTAPRAQASPPPMAPLLQLSDIALTFGGAPLFAGLDLALQPGDRLALVGRNGSGKSTLMKVMAGLVLPDSGRRSLSPGVRVGYMEQDPRFRWFCHFGRLRRAKP